jgi:hypothetical protein
MSFVESGYAFGHFPGLTLFDDHSPLAKSGLSLNAIGGPSRVLTIGVPLAYQGGCTLMFIISILIFFKCLTLILPFS